MSITLNGKQKLHELLLELALEANRHGSAGHIEGGPRVERITGFTRDTFSDMPAAGAGVDLKVATSFLVEKLAQERRVNYARMQAHADTIEELSAKRDMLQASAASATAASAAAVASSGEHGDGGGDDASHTINASWTDDASQQALLAKYKAGGWHAAAFYQELIRQERDRNEAAIVAMESRLIELLAKRRVTAGETALAGRRRALQRMKQEAFEEAEIERLTQIAREELAEEHGKAVERFRQAERQRLLEMDLEDQLLALEHEELELMAVRERATATGALKKKTPTNGRGQPRVHPLSTKGGTGGRGARRGKDGAASLDLYSTTSAREGFHNDGNIDDAVAEALSSRAAALAKLNIFEEFLSGGSLDVDVLASGGATK
eukprot:m.64174 g.64174  ORF g.64174 m.64174 type:complete len:379 (-) comp17850_c0_seq1:2843-3979(-)